MRIKLIITLFFVLISFLVGLLLYTTMPEAMAVHWGASGEVNGYASRFVGLFLMPIIMCGIVGLFFVLPKLDPLHTLDTNYSDWFCLILILFMIYVHGLTLLFNVGWKFNLVLGLIPAFSGLFYFLGSMMKNITQNWFIGIRTPWTLRSEVVWRKTHRFGARIFQICALIGLFGLVFVKLAIWFILVPIVVGTVGIVVYSYVCYRKEMKN